MKPTLHSYLRVAVPSPLHRHFDYLPPANSDISSLRPGMRVRVPFGKRQVVGVLLEIAAHTDIPATRLKRAQQMLDEAPLIPADMLALARWAADYYHHPIGEVIQALLPMSLRQGKSIALQVDCVWRLTTAGRQADAAMLKRAPKQLAVRQLLAQHPEGQDAATLDVHYQRWATPMKMLVKRGWVEKIQRVTEHAAVQTPIAPVVLNAAQVMAAEKIRAALGCFQAFLLDGVTGSGKTEVYLQVIAETLLRGRQALVLVPEIGLTPQLLERFRARFGTVAVFHSGLGDGERLATWLAARDGRVPVVIGTRSAVFVPLKNPGVIVVDEEHDTSFKQQDGFRYSARDIAVVRAQRQAIPIVLGSATPSLESLHNVDQLRYIHVALPERAGNARHPLMRLLDIRSRPLDEGLSDLLLDAIHRHLKADGQVLLFLNRRGYAPTVMCHGCGQTLQCPRCDARLTLHGNRRLQCHHCGAERPLPTRCATCGGTDFGHFGQGTERIERALERLFPDIGIARMDRDSTRRKGSLEGLLDAVRSGAYRILVGTQMLAKGHDFPKVTLVGILDADQGLFGVDFRASERMAQLIVQVAGRAGRAERPGEVLIQTCHPVHPLLTHLVREGYASFAIAALAERRVTGLPPCAAMALLRAEAAAATAPRVFLEAAKSVLAPHCGRQVQLLGPVPAPMERRAGRYRAQLLLLASQRALLQQALATALPALDALKEARRVRWSLDVDPAETY
ncbi:MAG TPA: primosomal protein N' [Gammaproteobacteria bacterium]|nr:primosomal protein N' [Gammaproteobacteria bacterium]